MVSIPSSELERPQEITSVTAGISPSVPTLSTEARVGFVDHAWPTWWFKGSESGKGESPIVKPCLLVVIYR